MGTCKKFVRKGCTWLPALGALALIVAASTPALGQLKPGFRPKELSGTCAGNLGLSVDTAGDIFSGNDVQITATLTASVSGGTTTNTETVTSFSFDLQCANHGSFGTCNGEAADTPVSWPAEPITTTCKDAMNNTVTWSGPAAFTPPMGGGTVTLTPSAPVFFPSNGSSCTITFKKHVTNTATAGLKTEAARWLGSCTIDNTTGLTGEADGTDFFNVDTCNVALDKQVSCDFAFWNDPARGNDPSKTTWIDVDPFTGAPACQGFTGDVIAIRYVIHNGGSVDLNSCSLTDVSAGATMTNVTPGLASATIGTIAAGSTFTSGAITEDATGTMNSLLCNPSHQALEPDLATVTCACVGASPTMDVHASDENSFSCVTCNAQIDKQVSCNGGAFTDVTCTNPPTNNSPPGCDPTASGVGNGLNVQSCTATNGYCSDGTVPLNSATCTGAMTGPDPTIPCDCTGHGTYVPGENITVQYVISNPGLEAGASMGSTALDELDNCTLMETNGAIVFAGTTIGNDIMREINDNDPNANCTGSAAAGTEVCIFAAGTTQTATAINECSNVLTHGETGGDTATLSCTCKPLLNNTGTMTVTRMDSAKFSCLQPQLQVVKTCAAQVAGTPPTNAVTVTATNGGTANLINCTATDNFNSTGACPQTTFPTAGPTLTPTPATNCPGPDGSTGCEIFTSGSQVWDGSIASLAGDACNTGTVSCTIAGSTATIMASSTTTCPVLIGGCETRTLGFWKTHPNITEAVMDFLAGDTAPIPVDTNFTTDPDVGLSSCGLNLTNVLPNNDCSAIVDLCINGQNAKNNSLGFSINPTQANLIMQCAAAELNLAVTRLDGFSCPADILGMGLTFDTCCGPGGACATGSDPAMISACDTAVDNFNGLFDNVTLSPNSPLNTPGAESDFCRATKGSGFINTAPPCTGSRTYEHK